jgi:hypothetical protein
VAASTIGLSWTEIRRWVAREIGLSRTSGDWDATNTTDLDDVIQAGLRQYYWPPNGHIWSFLQPTQTELEIYGGYETGTVGVVPNVAGAIATLTGGTWPSWAAGGELIVDGERYTVLSRSSNSVIILDSITADVDSGETYSLVQREYSLPSDFGGMIDPFTFRPGDPRYGLTKLNEVMIRSMEQGSRISGEPKYFCVTSVAPTSSQESKFAAIFYPLPPNDATYKLWYRYTVVPPMLDGSSYNYAHGSAETSETMLLSCLDKALKALWNDDSKHAEFLESLQAATSRDLRKGRPHSHGQGAYSDGYSPRAYYDYGRSRGDVTLDTTDL